MFGMVPAVQGAMPGEYANGLSHSQGAGADPYGADTQLPQHAELTVTPMYDSINWYSKDNPDPYDETVDLDPYTGQ
jgi:hypothetical protein